MSLLPLLYAATSLTTSEVTRLEGLGVGRMDGPEVSTSIVSSATLDEALLGGQVMADSITPCDLGGPIIWVMLQDVVIDVSQHHLVGGSTEDGPGNELHIGGTRLPCPGASCWRR